MVAFTDVPKEYDYQWIADRVGVRIIGVEEAGLYHRVNYDGSEESYFDDFSNAVAQYKYIYLPVAVASLKDELVEIRKKKVTEFSFGGMSLVLDYVTEARITSAAVYLDRNPSVTELNWDAGKGSFVTIPRANMLALADAAGAYVQDCFNHSKSLVEQIEACVDTDQLDAIDITAGWPVSS